MGLSRYLWNIFAFCGEKNTTSISLQKSSHFGFSYGYLLFFKSLVFSVCLVNNANAVLTYTAPITPPSTVTGTSFTLSFLPYLTGGTLKYQITALSSLNGATFTTTAGVALTPGAGGVLTTPTALSSTPRIIYIPPASYSGTDTLTFTIIDQATPTRGSVSGTLSVTVSAGIVNPSAPTITSALGNGNVTLTISSVPTSSGSAPSYIYLASCTGGGATITGQTTGPTVASSRTAKPTITLTLTNGTNYSCSVIAENATSTTYQSPPSNAVSVTPAQSGSNLTLTFLPNSSGNLITLAAPLPGETLNYTQPLHGSLAATAQNNLLAYTPAAGWTDSDSFTYQYYLGTGGPTAKTVTINLSPLPINATMTVAANSKNNKLSLITTNSAGVSLTGVQIATQAAHGTVTAYGTDVFYTPVPNYSGPDSFTYSVWRASTQSTTTGTVSVLVGHADLSQNTQVTGIVSNQTTATVHFSGAQVLNFQQRLESRHQPLNLPIFIATETVSTPPATNEARPDPAAAQTPSSDGAPSPDSKTPDSSQSPDGKSSPPPDKAGGNITAPAPMPTTNTPRVASKSALQYSDQAKTNLNNWQPTSVLSLKNDPNSLINQVRDPNVLGANDDAFASLMSVVSGAVINSSLDLASVTNALNKENKDPAQMDIWASGNLRIGTSSAGGTSSQFKTDGISIGEDRRVNRHWLIGVGLGYAVDNTTVGSDGTSSRSTGDSVTFYSSYQFDSGAYVDSLLGYGLMKYDTNRFDPAVNDIAKAQRTGSQWFGSVSLGYDFHDNGLTLSPYGRYDFSYDKLNGATETGTNAISYGVQKTHSSSLAFGLLGQTSHQTEYGIVQPHARIEYQRSNDVIGNATVAYTDLLSTQYTIAGTTQNSHSIVMGLGSNFLFGSSWNLGVDYSRLTSNQDENYQSLNFLLTKTFNEQKAFNWMLQDSEQNTAKKPTGLVASGTVTFDDNVTRADNGPDKLADTIFEFSASDTFNKIYSKRHLVSITAFADSYTYQSYTGLNELSGGLQAEYDYLANADFYAPIYGIFVRGAFDNYNSNLRTGSHHTFGVNYRKTFTDRISLTSVISDNSKAGNSIVFTTHDDSALLNLDYINGDYGTYYLTGEYRKGDVVSTGQASTQKYEMASWFVDDDVFSSAGLISYRLKAVTNIYTFGYNYSFGPKDSIDLSWRRVVSKPDAKPNNGQGEQYFVNQYSLSYLLAF